MICPKSALLYGFLLAVLLAPISGRKGFSGGGHKTGGISGGGHRTGGHLSGGVHGNPPSSGHQKSSHGIHSYPPPGGHQRPSGGIHSYPPPGGHQGPSGGIHSYPPPGGHQRPSGGIHSYPPPGGHQGPSGGIHSYPPPGGHQGPSGGIHSYPPPGGHQGPSGGSHSHPPSGGNHFYPPASPGGHLSGNSHGHPNKAGPVTHTTHVYNNYHYNPPQQISYAPVYGGPPMHYPVYHGTPPTYVYQYKDSGSKYGTLLAGLALLNLGTLAGATYAHSRSSQYKPQPGEVCKFAVEKDNGESEVTKINCKIISSFILDNQAQTQNTGHNSTLTMTTVTNTTMVNTTNMMPGQSTTLAPVVPMQGSPLYTMLPNGTFVPVNGTGVPNVPGIPRSPSTVQPNGTNAASTNGSVMTSSVVTMTTITNTKVANALDVKGKPVKVTPGMKCYVIHSSPTSTMKKNVQCGLLQIYAEKSIRRSSAARDGPMFTTMAAILAFCVAY